jgi:hypothetical protein
LTIEIASPGDLARLLRGQNVRGLSGLQVDGTSRLDGGAIISGGIDLSSGDIRVRSGSIYVPGVGGVFAPTLGGGHVIIKATETDLVGGVAITTVSFNGLPQTFRNISYRAVARDTSANIGLINMVLQFNGDSGAHYFDVQNQATTNSANPTTTGAVGATAGRGGLIVQGANSEPAEWGNSYGWILNYSSPIVSKNWTWFATAQVTGTGPFIYQGGGHWYDGAGSGSLPVTSITFSSDGGATWRGWIELFFEP